MSMNFKKYIDSVNINGQFSWIELATDRRIERTIIDLSSL